MEPCEGRTPSPADGIRETPEATVPRPSSGTVAVAPPPPEAGRGRRCGRATGKARGGEPAELNWRTSIVDLLKLLDIDSSFAARKELATELACPAELMGESAKMNVWLHETMLARLAANGGNVPKELLD